MNLRKPQIPCQLSAPNIEAADVIGSSQALYQMLGSFSITFCYTGGEGCHFKKKVECLLYYRGARDFWGGYFEILNMNLCH